MKVLFEKGDAYGDYLYWQKKDKKKFDRINKLLKNCKKTPYAGLGKPHPLKHEYSGYWSRRIDEEHRLVYKVTDEAIVVAGCKYHYKK